MDVGYICAAAASIQDCESDPAGTARLNVEATLTLAAGIKERGARVVLLSSSRVFSGRQPGMTPTAAPDPVTEYGRQKLEVERALLDSGGGHCVARLTRVIAGWPLLERWREVLQAGQQIEACDDMAISPVPLETVIQGLIRIAERSTAGILHFSGPHDLSYSDLARELARRIGADDGRVLGRTAAQLGIAPWLPMRFATLDTRETAKKLGITFPKIADCRF